MKNSLQVTCREEWRAWLKENHATSNEVWLVSFKKKTGLPTVSYEDAVQEALCYGWIDSLVKRIDDSRYAQKYTPRKPRSKWSQTNLDRIAKLRREGRMTGAGLATLPSALKPTSTDRDDTSLADASRWFMRALHSHKKAMENFNRLAPSYRKLYIRWVADAKREETRLRRVNEAIKLLQQNKKLGLK